MPPKMLPTSLAAVAIGEVKVKLKLRFLVPSVEVTEVE